MTASVIEPLRKKSLLFAGIGASYAVTGTPVHQLRAAGITAFRTDCSDSPLGTPALAEVYIAVSQSGRSRETAQLILSSDDIDTVSITNSVHNPLSGLCATNVSVGDFTDSRVSSIGSPSQCWPTVS